MNRLVRPLLSFLILGAVCYAALSFFGEGSRFWSSLASFPPRALVPMAGLALCNYLLRFARWELYLRALGIRLPLGGSFIIFMAGLTMTITPGKAGEALKAHLLKERQGYPWSQGLPVVFAERLMDLLGVVFLVGISLPALPTRPSWIYGGMGLSALILALLIHPRLLGQGLGWVFRLPGLRSFALTLLEMHGHVQTLMRPRLLFMALGLSVAAWWAECLVLQEALRAMGLQPGLLASTLVYSLSTLAGALSALPGGLLATEGSMAGLLLLQGVGRNTAAMLTFVVRLCTLWFAVGLGLLFYLGTVLRPRPRPPRASAQGKAPQGETP